MLSYIKNSTLPHQFELKSFQYSFDQLMQNNSTSMGFQSTDLNIKSDSMPFFQTNAHNRNSEPKCLSSSLLSSRAAKQNGYSMNNNRISESCATLFGHKINKKYFQKSVEFTVTKSTDLASIVLIWGISYSSQITPSSVR